MNIILSSQARRHSGRMRENCMNLLRSGRWHTNRMDIDRGKAARMGINERFSYRDGLAWFNKRSGRYI